MKKMSEIYKDMDEVIAVANSFRVFCTDEEFELIKMVFGIAENKAITEVVIIDGIEIFIDKSIVSLIKELNDKGIKTIACCSGLISEHIDGIKPVSGYLAIAYSEDLFNYLKEKLTDEIFTVKHIEVYLEDAVSTHINTINEDILKEKWDLIHSILISYTSNN